MSCFSKNFVLAVASFQTVSGVVLLRGQQDTTTKNVVPADAPAILQRLYTVVGSVDSQIHAESGDVKFSPANFPEDKDTVALVADWQASIRKEDPPAGKKAPLDGIDDDVKACKSELPDKHAYANCVLKAMVGEMANLDFLNKMPEGEKKNFCATTPDMFRMLAAILQSRFEKASAAPPPAPAEDEAGSAPAQDGPSDAVFRQMQDLAFVQSALEAFEKFCQ